MAFSFAELFFVLTSLCIFYKNFSPCRQEWTTSSGRELKTQCLNFLTTLKICWYFFTAAFCFKANRTMYAFQISWKHSVTHAGQREIQPDGKKYVRKYYAYWPLYLKIKCGLTNDENENSWDFRWFKIAKQTVSSVTPRDWEISL